MLRNIICVGTLSFLLFSQFGCGIRHREVRPTPTIPGVGEVLSITVEYPMSATRNNETGILGWIYLNKDDEPGAEACIYIKYIDDHGIWEYSSETTPGYFADTEYSGVIGDDGQLDGFPIGGLSEAVGIWRAGAIQAKINGQEVPST